MTIDMRQNIIKTKDSFFQIWGTRDYQFFDIGDSKATKFTPTIVQNDEGIYFLIDIRLSSKTITHSRTIYDVLAFLGDFGGL